MAEFDIPREVAKEPGRTHLDTSRGQERLPESPTVQGRFGRLFPNLPSFEPSDATIAACLDQMLEQPAGGWDAPDLDNPIIPAGYTYLGQFIDHDLTFDPVSSLDRQSDPDALHNFRSPNFDLDSVYGAGRNDQPYLFQRDDRDKLLIGAGGGQGEGDLPRNTEQVATIGDPRNDENIIIGQLQHAFLRFHNQIVDDIRAEGSNGRPDLRPHLWSTGNVFQEAQRLVRWHYQWIVLTDFLPRICGDFIHEFVEGLPPQYEGCIRFRGGKFYHPGRVPFIPVEWSVAAYRFGHSMIRPSYHLNETLRGLRDGRPIELFIEDPEAAPLEHLGGKRQLPAFWSIDWRFYFAQADAGERLQHSRVIDTRLAAALKQLPGISDGMRFLAERNLKRGKVLGLPSGQAVARRMCVPELSKDALGLEGEAPLWFYILREAEQDPIKGQKLGPVGARIVAETMIGMLKADPFSFVMTNPGWRPVLPLHVATKSEEWAMADLLAYAVPDDGRTLAAP